MFSIIKTTFLEVRDFEKVMYQIEQSIEDRNIELFKLLKQNGMVEASK